ncbi:hypothetical protein I8H83_03805 [Candidatus Saccharibacteria bacterium]|nr:hypothetical protein [Candidatus Saccharibacteria bacterium]
MAMVPHRENQYKPHLIRRHGLLVICVVVLLVQLITNLNYFRNILGTENQVSVADLLVDTNTERQKAGLEPLTLDTRLSDAAYMKAKDMLANEYWSHSSPTGVQPWKWLGDADYNYSYAGENLARNFNSSRGVVSAWMASPSHRENILKKQYQDVGFATVDGTMDGRPISLVVAMYGTPATAGIGAVRGVNFVAPATSQLSFASQVGIGLQSLSPAILSSVILLLLAAVVALLAQLYHRHIPKYLQSTWNRHHGAVKALGLSSLVIVVVALYTTNGQL